MCWDGLCWSSECEIQPLSLPSSCSKWLLAAFFGLQQMMTTNGWLIFVCWNTQTRWGGMSWMTTDIPVLAAFSMWAFRLRLRKVLYASKFLMRTNRDRLKKGQKWHSNFNYTRAVLLRQKKWFSFWNLSNTIPQVETTAKPMVRLSISRRIYRRAFCFFSTSSIPFL